MMIFKYEFPENEHVGGIKVELSISEQSTLPEVLDAFEQFLLGAGYRFEGQLDFVTDEESGNEQD